MYLKTGRIKTGKAAELRCETHPEKPLARHTRAQHAPLTRRKGVVSGILGSRGGGEPDLPQCGRAF